MQPAVGFGNRKRRVRLKVKLLDALRPPGSGHHVGGSGQGRVDVAAFDARHLQDIVVLGIDPRRARLDRLGRVDHRRAHLVFDLHQFGGSARRVSTIRGNRRQAIGDRAHLLALGNEARPILVDEADPAAARHVLGGGNRHHAGQSQRLRHVDAFHQRPRMVRQHHGAMQQSRHLDIGKERPRSERELGAAIALQRLADAAVEHRCRQRAVGMLGGVDQFDGVDDLGIAGAAAQMPVDDAGDLGARERTVLVGQPFGAQHDARRAEAALQTGCRLERVGVKLAFVVGDAFQRHDGAAGDPLGLHHAGVLRLAVDQRQAAAAQALRRAGVLH